MGNLCVGVDTKSPGSFSLSNEFPPSTSDPGSPFANCRITTCAGVLDIVLQGLLGSSSSVTEETSELARYMNVCCVEGVVVSDVTDETEPVRELKKFPSFLVSAGGCGDETGEWTDEEAGGDSGVAGAMEGPVAEPAPFQSLKLHLDGALVSSVFTGVAGGGVFGNDEPASPTRNSEM